MLGQVLFHLLAFFPQAFGFVIQAHVFRGVMIQGEQVIADAGALLVQFRQAVLQILVPIVLDTTDPAQFLPHELVNPLIVGQPLQVGPDQPDDVLLHQISRNGVSLGAGLMIAAMMCATDVVTSTVALTAGRGLGNQFAAAHAALAQADDEIFSANGSAPSVSLPGP